MWTCHVWCHLCPDSLPIRQNPERTFYWFFEATCPVSRDAGEFCLFDSTVNHAANSTRMRLCVVRWTVWVCREVWLQQRSWLKLFLNFLSAVFNTLLSSWTTHTHTHSFDHRLPSEVVFKRLYQCLCVSVRCKSCEQTRRCCCWAGSCSYFLSCDRKEKPRSLSAWLEGNATETEVKGLKHLIHWCVLWKRSFNRLITDDAHSFCFRSWSAVSVSRGLKWWGRRLTLTCF